MNHCLQAQQISLTIGKRKIIHPLDLQFELGQFVSLIGPNGAGKSTLLRLLTGFTRPTSGECYLEGQSYPAWHQQKLSRRRAVMRQHNHLAFAMTAQEVLQLALSDVPSVQRREIYQQVVELVGCQRLLMRNYLTLSGGEQQQIQLARVLAQLWQQDQPQGWLFLDEPTAALDLYHQQHLLRLLHQLTRSKKLMVCCVLHDVNLAATWADRIVVLRQGQLVADGDVPQVLTAEQLTQWYQAELIVTQPEEVQRPVVLLKQ